MCVFFIIKLSKNNFQWNWNRKSNTYLRLVEQWKCPVKVPLKAVLWWDWSLMTVSRLFLPFLHLAWCSATASNCGLMCCTPRCSGYIRSHVLITQRSWVRAASFVTWRFSRLCPFMHRWSTLLTQCSGTRTGGIPILPIRCCYIGILY